LDVHNWNNLLIIQGLRDKKIGAGNGDPNLRFQPRLPGSVVGEWSMQQGPKINKITEGSVQK
jgi:hypothetical protein